MTKKQVGKGRTYSTYTSGHSLSWKEVRQRSKDSKIEAEVMQGHAYFLPPNGFLTLLSYTPRNHLPLRHHPNGLGLPIQVTKKMPHRFDYSQSHGGIFSVAVPLFRQL